jgi:hypothetical protein
MPRTSYSQTSVPCGYQLFLRELTWAHERGQHQEAPVRLCRRCRGLPEPPEWVGLPLGRAIHEGIEAIALGRSVREGEARALLVMRARLREARRGARPLRFDLRYDESPGPVDGASVLKLARLGARAWGGRFGHLRAVEVEREVRLPLDPWGMSGWQLTTRLDLLTADGGIVDVKTTGRRGKEIDDARLIQARLYQLAYRHHCGRWPEYFVFHVLSPRPGAWEIEAREVPLDEAAIERIMEHFVVPAARAREAGIYLPNLMGWWHSPTGCDWWDVCPHGADAHVAWTS